MNKPSFLTALDARNAAAIEKSTRATLEHRAALVDAFRAGGAA